MGAYRVNSKYTQPSEADVVTATYTGADASKVEFITPKGIKYLATKSGNTFTVNVSGGPDGDAQEIYAAIKGSDGNYQSIGKLLVPSYKALRRKVKLVYTSDAIKTAQASKLGNISKELNAIYNPYGVTWDVDADPDVFSDVSWDADKNGLNLEGAGTFTNLTEEMKALNATYAAAKGDKIDPLCLYMFVFNTPGTAGVQGDMPRLRQYGYLFTDGQSDKDLAHTVAHELAHGAFMLRHPFDNYVGLAQGNIPSNLMDYNGGQEIAKLQWDIMHDPGIVLGVFEKDEDAEYTKNNCKYVFANKLSKCGFNSHSCPGYQNAFSIPYEKLWKKFTCVGTYWASLPAYEIGQLDDNGNPIKTKIYVKLNSQYTYNDFTRNSRIDQFPGVVTDYGFNVGIFDLYDYEDAINAWKLKNYKSVTDANLQSSTAITALANAIIKNGELDPTDMMGLKEGVLYPVEYNLSNGKTEVIYYNSEELTYWIWGYFASYKFNFVSLQEVMTFGFQYCGREVYSNIFGSSIWDTPWKAQAIADGQAYRNKTYADKVIQYNIDQNYAFTSDRLINGTGPDDVIEVGLWLTGGGATNKIVVEMSKKMFTAAIINLTTQIAINVIGDGMTVETAISKVDYTDVAWAGVTKAIQNESTALTLDCLKDMVDEYQKLLGVNPQKVNVPLQISYACLKSLLKNVLLKNLLQGTNSPYGQLLMKAFKNKTVAQIRDNIRRNLQCNDKEIDEIFEIIPDEFIKTLIK